MCHDPTTSLPLLANIKNEYIVVPTEGYVKTHWYNSILITRCCGGGLTYLPYLPSRAMKGAGEGEGKERN
jgi:hypothetical protein